MPGDRVVQLKVLDAEVEARGAAIVAEVPDWPCRAGCDHCCRTLGAPVVITDVEFDRLRAAIESLAAPRRREVQRRLASLLESTEAPRVCPLLDPESGRCTVYNARPIACRTYGYYVGRDGDYWCAQVAAHVAPVRHTFIAGNQLAVDRLRDQQLGPSRSLAEHLRGAASVEDHRVEG